MHSTMLDSAAGPILDWLRNGAELTPVSGLGLAGIFIVASFGIPRVLLNIAAGAAFGFWSFLIVQPSATVGAVLAFLFARHLIAEYVRRHIEAKPVLKAVAGAIDWRIVALSRLASPIPSPVANYIFGVTPIGVWPYAAATFLFTVPQNVLQIYLGATGRAILLEETLSPLSLVLMLAGLACLAITTLVVVQRARVALSNTNVAG
jgi:uncharacterized membrane protein YdjX (TVP38/TMEM64 family)